MEEKHLEILVKLAPKKYLKKLYLYPAKFPEETNFPEKSFNAVLASRVLHFLDGNKIEKGLKKIHSWLIPGGTFYFISMSAYHDAIKDNFFHIYQKNVAAGMKWPGEIECQWDLAPDHKDYVPAFLHVFTATELKKILAELGFIVTKIGLFNYPE